MIYFLEIFSQNLKLFGQKSLFLVRSMLILQKNLQKISIFVKNFWPVWPVNFLLLTRLTRNIFPFDPPTRWKIVGWPVTRPDPWNFQICWPDPTRTVENLLLPDPTRPVVTRSIPSVLYLTLTLNNKRRNWSSKSPNVGLRKGALDLQNLNWHQS